MEEKHYVCICFILFTYKSNSTQKCVLLIVTSLACLTPEDSVLTLCIQMPPAHGKNGLYSEVKTFSIQQLNL